MLICACCDVGEVTICVEFHQRSKPMKRVGCNAWCILNDIPQLNVVCMEDGIGLPLFVHVVGVPQRTELCGQWFKGLDVREGRTFQHLPCDEHD